MSVRIEVRRVAVLELVATGAEEVSRVSVCVASDVRTVSPVVPVGTADRLKVMPNSDVLVLVLLVLPEMPIVAVTDCS